MAESDRPLTREERTRLIADFLNDGNARVVQIHHKLYDGHQSFLTLHENKVEGGAFLMMAVYYLKLAEFTFPELFYLVGLLWRKSNLIPLSGHTEVHRVQ